MIAFGGRTMRSDKSIAKYVNSPESVVYRKNLELYGLYLLKMRQSELVDSQHGLASVLRGTLLVGKLFLYYLYIVLPREITKSLLI